MNDTLAFYHRQLLVRLQGVDPETVDLRAKTAIITGANAGLGLEICRQLVDLEIGELILAVRSTSKGDAAVSELKGKGKATRFQVWSLDMNSYESIQAFAKRAEALQRLDYAMLNAGVVKTTFGLNPKTGHEETIQVNWLSTALLTILLLPILKSKNSPTTPGTLSIVGSDTAEWATFKEQYQTPIISALDTQPKPFDPAERYWTSKLLQQLFLRGLTERISPEVAIVNISNPGLTQGTELTRDLSGPVSAFFAVYKKLLGRPLNVGAKPMLRALIAEGKRTHGGYFTENDLAPLARRTTGPESYALSRRLWDELMNELEFANVKEIIATLADRR